MNWYARIVAHHPYVILVAVAVFAGTCLVIPLTTKKLPNFKDPQLGFETRGTVIAQRLTAWENLLDASRPSGPLTLDPNIRDQFKDVSPPQQESATYESKGKILADKMIASESQMTKSELTVATPNDVTGFDAEKDTGILLFTAKNTSEIVTGKQRNISPAQEGTLQLDEWEVLGKEAKSLSHDEDIFKQEEDHHHHHLDKDGFFCNAPGPDYSRVVLTLSTNGDLFTLDSLRAICQLDARLREGEEFSSLCQTIDHTQCCHSWSLPNYIALQNNRSSCTEITEEDVESTKDLLKQCAHFYHSMQLTHDCEDQTENRIYCQLVPNQCSKHNMIFNMLHYILDTGFLPPNNTTDNALTSTMLILPIAKSTSTIKYFNSLELKSLRIRNVEIEAMEFGLKSTLFDECLVKDTWMIGAGGTFILISMWLYTGSLFITLMTVIAIAFSLGISYFIYTLVFELKFFPFMNLLASIVAVGIGADDAFIFCKVWQCSKAEKNNGTLVKLVHDTLRQATLSMFVTSLTTAAAFYASYVSSITAICCFSIFAGTATLANFLLMVTWLPASVVVSERWCCPPMMPPQWFQWDTKLRPARALAVQARAMLDKLLLLGVMKLRFFWLVLLGGIALASVVVVFYHPKLKLPDSRDFQLFASSHPFEKYDLIYRDKYWFERPTKTGSGGNSDTYKLPLRFVWGVFPVDNGDYLDPFSRGTLVMDPSFDVSTPEAQVWLLAFCRNLRNQSFYQPMWGPLLPNCFIENFITWMQRRCVDTMDNIDRTPCCETAKFPYSADVFDQCIVQAMSQIFEAPGMFFFPGVAGPRFSKSPLKLVAAVVEFESNETHSMSFEPMDRFYKNVERWMRKQLKKAPPGMKGGWFISQLDFYDLQKTLSRDTLAAIGVSMGIALVVLLVVTLNILISLYAILTIVAIIFVTVATLVLLGWKLNVLESIAISVAIGLAVDFSLHYGVHYKLSPGGEGRRAASSHAISRMGGPTAMAALTTAAAGAFMLPSSVLAYIQIGAFLIVVMGVSWIYSTFFLGSLLRVAGPENGFGQFAYPTPKKCCDGESPRRSATGDRVDKTVYTNVLSESTLSTSSTMCALHTSESHELEALTGRSRRPRSIRTGSLSAAIQAAPLAPRKVSLPANSDQSPSATSATTIVLIDDLDLETRPKRDDPLVRY